MERIEPWDLRTEPRYRTHFKAIIENQTSRGEGLVTNLSMSGLQLSCSHSVMSALTPNIHRPAPRVPVQAHVHFQVPTSQKSRADIDLTCNVIYSRRLAQNQYVVGAHFGHFEHDSEQLLHDYLQHFGERL